MNGFLFLLVVVAAAPGAYNASKNRDASEQEFLSCWRPLEAQDMKANPPVGGIAAMAEGMRAEEVRIGPSVDYCMAQKVLFITRESRQSCVSDRVQGCYFRPWLRAAAK
ncbi:MAG: acylphosphatase [Pseudomonadota bacterium]|nr:acylphosphatase [Pseudomonadota bacterium]